LLTVTIEITLRIEWIRIRILCPLFQIFNQTRTGRDMFLACRVDCAINTVVYPSGAQVWMPGQPSTENSIMVGHLYEWRRGLLSLNSVAIGDDGRRL